jgi:hypothetical protein
MTSVITLHITHCVTGQIKPNGKHDHMVLIQTMVSMMTLGKRIYLVQQKLKQEARGIAQR